MDESKLIFTRVIAADHRSVSVVDRVHEPLQCALQPEHELLRLGSGAGGILLDISPIGFLLGSS